MSKDEARQKIAELVAKYRSLSPRETKKYNEAMTKQGFIEPMFRALGWDFDDVNEVTPEESASKGRVDYAFKLNGVAQFYVEAKSLKADLTNPEHVKQANTYAYNKGVTWALLTDFEGLRLFNAQKYTPYINLSYEDYAARLDKLWLLSRDSLEKGLLNKEAAQDGALPLSVAIEKRLFNQLRHWREDLYNQLSGYNKSLNPAQIDQSIQRLLNRLIFIRTCEDRNIEERRLLAAVHQWQSAGRKKDKLATTLRHIFHEFDGYYDSELFAAHIIDSDQVFIEEPTIESILNGLYDIPGAIASYDFSLIDADVLGQVYEQYLGYVATKKKQKPQVQMTFDLPGKGPVEFSEKKQHRKEQGIYYTPKFITNYIVKETVGRFLTERSYNEILGVKILDPACGSGSFLIRAYDELLNYHAAQRGKTAVQLDQFDRMPFLTANIFGVDLDRQAIEIARLNLLLRGLAKRETLPTLADNIREGNSLISGTEEELKSCFGDAWHLKKPFNWEEKFADIMKSGGFDVVIGNPPYVQFSMDAGLEPALKRYLVNTFNSSMGRLNAFGFFIHRGISLLKPGGFLGFIIPNTFLTQEYYKELRKFILDTCKIVSVVVLEEMPFEAAIIENVIVILKRQSSAKCRDQNEVLVKMLGNNKEYCIPQTVFRESFNCGFGVYLSADLRAFREKIDSQSNKLNGLVEINQAIALRYDRASSLFKKALDKRYKNVLDGRDIGRYSLNFPGNYLLYDVDSIHSCKREDIFLAKEKILFRRVGDRIVATLDDQQYYALNTLVVVTPKVEGVNLKFILGLMNSRLINSYYRLFLKSTKRVFSEIQARQMGQVPIRNIDFANPDDQKKHDDIVALVGKMLALQKRLEPIRGKEHDSYDRDFLLGQTEETDREIDNLIYDLYGLSDKERAIIEESHKS